MLFEEKVSQYLSNFIVLEKKGKTYDYGILMLYLDKSDNKQFIQFGKKHIPDEVLTNDGREDEPHVTCLYGFKPKTDMDKVKAFIKQEVTEPLTLTLKKVSRFENDHKGFHVIKIEVECAELKSLYKKLRKEFADDIENEYPTWKGHITLAYVEPGECKDLDGNDTFDGKEFTVNKLILKSANGDKSTINLD